MIEHFYQRIHGCFTFAEFYKHVIETDYHTNWRGVEVGALYGQSAAYLAVEMANAGNGGLLDIVEWSSHFYPLSDNLKPVAHMIGAIHSPMASVDAAKLYADASLDFVMLDADHSLQGVRADIAAWYPKVKPDGILAGHDFSHYFPGVMRAALERFPHLHVWAGSEWPDAHVSGQRDTDARADITRRSAHGEQVDFMPVWWVRV